MARSFKRTIDLRCALLLFFVALAGCTSIHAASTPSRTSIAPTTQPTVTLTPLPIAPIAAALTYAYVSDNDVWVSIHGTSPRQITHLGATGATIAHLVISADHTLILASGGISGEPNVLVWLITLPADVVTTINLGNISQTSSVAALAVNCMSNSSQLDLQTCRIIADRYLVGCSLYHSAHVISCLALDLRTGQAVQLPQALDQLTNAEITSDAIYYSPFVPASNAPATIQPQPIYRYDFASGATTEIYHDFYSAEDGWSIAARTQQIIGSGPGCTTLCYYAGTQSPVPVFPAQSVALAPSIAPDGSQAAMSRASALIVWQQSLPTGQVVTTHLNLPDPQSQFWSLGTEYFAGGSVPGVVAVAANGIAGQENSYYAYFLPAAGGVQAIIPTLTAATLAFAPLDQ